MSLSSSSLLLLLLFKEVDIVKFDADGGDGDSVLVYRIGEEKEFDIFDKRPMELSVKQRTQVWKHATMG